MEVLQTARFEKQTKKPHPQMKKVLDEAIQQILENPLVGESKIGDIQGVYVYKFRLQNQLMLLAYVFSPSSLTLVSFGSHENFYRDLKKVTLH
jgi:mRNA interferase RelE/StbE